jgi:hypothetical protein
MKFTLNVEYEVELNVSEIWPDGDAPTTPTTQDVADRMVSAAHGPVQLLHDWMIGPQYTDLYVTGPGGTVYPWWPRQNAEIARPIREQAESL